MSADQLKKNLVIHAPNIHTGGGLVLLKEILNLPNLPIKWLHLDRRAEKTFKQLKSVGITHYVSNSIFSRFLAEWRLWRNTSCNDIILCFHGLPPLFTHKGKVIVFIHNRLLLQGKLNNYTLRTKTRIVLERIWLYTLHKKNIKYIVQTPSMIIAAQNYLGYNINIIFLPFAPNKDLIQYTEEDQYKKKFDFIYPASGEAHKNHLNLLKAWHLLEDTGLRPTLALTIDSKKYPSLFKEVEDYTKEFNLNIVNLRELPRADILVLYKSARALIFPSLIESFGLPLIEASHYRLPILASELDYVWDIINPEESFDPNSPLSIARAVKRFLGKNEPLLEIHSAEAFFKEIMQ